jgi:S-phase kinase-associated protein 1
MSITLVSMKDQTKVDVDKTCVRHSTLLKNLVEEYKDDNEVSIPEVDGATLKYICEYLSHYKDTDPVDVKKPLEKYDIKETYGEWEDTYIKQFEGDKASMWKLMEAANYIDCKNLLELACSKVAVMIKDYSGKEMVEYFGLEEDLTEEEAEKYREELEKKFEEEKEKAAREQEEKEEAEEEAEEGENKDS